MVSQSLAMSKKTFLPLLFSICLLFIYACDPQEEPATPEKWEKAEGFQNGLSFAREINGALYAASRSRVFANASTGGPNDFSELSLFMQSMPPYRLPLSEQLMAAINPSQLFILPAGNSNQENALTLNMRDIDPEFTEFHFLHYFLCEQISINPDGTVMVPYRSAKDGKQKNTPDFLWVKTAVNAGKVELLEYKLIKEEFFAGISTIRILKDFPSFTRVTLDGKTFDIDRAGNLELRFERFAKSVQVGDEIITFARPMPFDNLPWEVYKSDLSGKNNQLLGTYSSSQISPLDNFILSQMADNLFSIDGKIILNNLDAIYRIDINSEGIKLIELENEGLQNAQITSITQLDNSSIFVTAVCDSGTFNNCGGFTKSLENFFKLKETQPQL